MSDPALVARDGPPVPGTWDRTAVLYRHSSTPYCCIGVALPAVLTGTITDRTGRATQLPGAIALTGDGANGWRWDWDAAAMGGYYYAGPGNPQSPTLVVYCHDIWRLRQDGDGSYVLSDDDPLNVPARYGDAAKQVSCRPFVLVYREARTRDGPDGNMSYTLTVTADLGPPPAPCNPDRLLPRYWRVFRAAYPFRGVVTLAWDDDPPPDWLSGPYVPQPAACPPQVVGGVTRDQSYYNAQAVAAAEAAGPQAVWWCGDWQDEDDAGQPAGAVYRGWEEVHDADAAVGWTTPPRPLDARRHVLSPSPGATRRRFKLTAGPWPFKPYACRACGPCGGLDEWRLCHCGYRPASGPDLAAWQQCVDTWTEHYRTGSQEPKIWGVHTVRGPNPEAWADPEPAVSVGWGQRRFFVCPTGGTCPSVMVVECSMIGYPPGGLPWLEAIVVGERFFQGTTVSRKRKSIATTRRAIEESLGTKYPPYWCCEYRERDISGAYIGQPYHECVPVRRSWVYAAPDGGGSPAWQLRDAYVSGFPVVVPLGEYGTAGGGVRSGRYDGAADRIRVIKRGSWVGPYAYGYCTQDCTACQGAAGPVRIPAGEGRPTFTGDPWHSDLPDSPAASDGLGDPACAPPLTPVPRYSGPGYYQTADGCEYLNYEPAGPTGPQDAEIVSGPYMAGGCT